MDFLNAPGYVEAWNACSRDRGFLSGGRPSSNMEPEPCSPARAPAAGQARPSPAAAFGCGPAKPAGKRAQHGPPRTRRPEPRRSSGACQRSAARRNRRGSSTIWRWLHDDALKPWQQRSWIFVRDPRFPERARAGPIPAALRGRRLRPDELVICADEKSQLQALGRRHETIPPRPGRPALVEFEYRRRGTLAYLAAWEVHHASLFDRVAPKTGIEPFGRLVEQVMTSEPYKVEGAVSRLRARFERSRLGLVELLNQILEREELLDCPVPIPFLLLGRELLQQSRGLRYLRDLFRPERSSERLRWIAASSLEPRASRGTTRGTRRG